MDVHLADRARHRARRQRHVFAHQQARGGRLGHWPELRVLKLLPAAGRPRWGSLVLVALELVRGQVELTESASGRVLLARDHRLAQLAPVASELVLRSPESPTCNVITRLPLAANLLAPHWGRRRNWARPGPVQTCALAAAVAAAAASAGRCAGGASVASLLLLLVVVVLVVELCVVLAVDCVELEPILFGRQLGELLALQFERGVVVSESRIISAEVVLA